MRRLFRVLFPAVASAVPLLFCLKTAGLAQELLTAGCYFSQGDYRGAIRHLSALPETEEVDPGLVDYLLGLSYWNVGELGPAVEHLRMASESRADSPEILLMLAAALEEQGKPAQAYTLYGRVLDLTSERSALAWEGVERTRPAADRAAKPPSSSSQVTLQGGPDGIQLLSSGKEEGLLIELRTEANREKVLAGVPLRLILRVVNQAAEPVKILKRPSLKWSYWREEDSADTKMGGALRAPKLNVEDNTTFLQPGQQVFFPLSPIAGLRPGIWQFQARMEMPAAPAASSLPSWIKAPPLRIEVTSSR